MFKAIKLLSFLSASLAATVTQSNSGANELRLIELDEHTQMWVTEQEKTDLKMYGFDFMDITDYQDLASIRPHTLSKAPFPKSLKSQDQVKSIIKTLSVDNLKANIEKLTSFENRNYKGPSGVESQKWIVQKIKEITAQFASKELQDAIEISEFKHTWDQSSIIVRIKGLNEKLGVVLISAHQDTFGGRSPGADDDGSGTISILEAFRGVVASGKRFNRTVEFHWYSAEEQGLLGSQAVAKDYASRGVDVYAQQQFDMTAWVKKGTKEVVGIITDYVDKDLTEFNKLLVNEYLSIPYTETKCGYACSDHGSWTKAGYPSSFTFESVFRDHSPYIHSSKDTYDISPEFSFPHMLEFSKLGVSFIVELGNSIDA